MQVVSECPQMCEIYKRSCFWFTKTIHSICVYLNRSTDLTVQCTVQCTLYVHCRSRENKLQLQTMTWNMSWLLPTCQVIVSVKLLDKWFCFHSYSLGMCRAGWLTDDCGYRLHYGENNKIWVVCGTRWMDVWRLFVESTHCGKERVL